MPTALTTTATIGTAITPEDRSSIVLLPLTRDSLALRTAFPIPTRRDEVRVPRLTGDAPASFVEEGADLPEGAPTVDELALRPAKIGLWKPISRELAEDSDPTALSLIGESFARSLRTALDTAFIASDGTGLGGKVPAGVLTADNSTDGGTLTGASLDPLQDALTQVEAAGGTPSVIALHPDTWGVLAKLKDETGSSRPLLGSPTDGKVDRTLFGVPVFVDATVPTDLVGVWDRNAIAVVLRQDVQFEASREALFRSDSIALRSTIRAAWGVLDEGRVVRIAVDLA
ncbi:phage major capsid protein [Kineococcus rhizosphaerae]|uniref:HK97 family phage major capsid protein n=1 Tax=Kineococcus rhizosphaerae TaxID=559628 RepID=A0A2T0QNI1_9ACTN|nr:phage major capsid protein [Kineococcus rhizosphaerae]PRY06094.1 HK97 family phage major capsid protein [Kineococcus rhizosphaerae]